MAQYRRSPPQQRLTAAIGAVLVHALLAVLILSGFDVEPARRVVQRLTVFSLNDQPPPPPVPEPPSAAEASAPEEQAAPPNQRSQATPVEAPPPAVRLPVPPSVAVSPTPSSGSDPTSGAAATAGPGTGAGGDGSGLGGGGLGGVGSGRGGGAPALLVRNLRDRDYRQIAGDRLPAGRAALQLRVEPDGGVSRCRVVGSSGDSMIDGNLCAVTVRRLRFRPALDSAGRPVAEDIVYIATWRPR